VPWSATTCQGDRLAVADHRGGQAGAKLGQIGADLDLVDAARGVQVRLHLGHRDHPLVGVLQVEAGLLGGDGPGLEQQDAGDDLQAVGDPVLHFLRADLFLAQQFQGALEHACFSRSTTRRAVMSVKASRMVALSLVS
jgi:hypothetical protein